MLNIRRPRRVFVVVSACGFSSLCCLARGRLAHHEDVKILPVIMTGTGKKTPGDHTDEPHNHPNPPTHPHDLATTESAAGSTAAAQEEEPNAPRGRLRRGRLQRSELVKRHRYRYSTVWVRRSCCCSTQRAFLAVLAALFRQHNARSLSGPQSTGATAVLVRSCYRSTALNPPADRSCGLQSVAYLYVLSALCFKPLHTFD